MLYVPLLGALLYLDLPSWLMVEVWILKVVIPIATAVSTTIPLAWAHARGGATWTPAQKAAFANDPVNLLAVDDGLNQSKGARGPSEWLPPNPGYVCVYLFRWVSVLSAYPDLSLTDHESRQLSLDLSRCR